MRALILLLLLACGIAAAEEPWLTYHVFPGELAVRDDSQPRVAVFADGRVRVYRPRWQVGAGAYEYQLDPKALATLVAEATDPAVIGLDLAATENAMSDLSRRIARDERRVFAVADPDTYLVEIDAATAPGTRSPAAGRVALLWETIHPTLAARAVEGRARIEGLAERLRALADVEGARRVGAPVVASERAR